MAGKIGSFLMSKGRVAAGRTSDAVDKGIKGVYKPLDKAADAAAGGAIAGAKTLHKAAPLVKRVDKDWTNLGLGIREGRGLIAATAVGGVGYNMYHNAKQPYMDPQVGTYDYTGTAPIMDAEGVGTRSKAPTLGATGDMVFGMHQARKG